MNQFNRRGHWRTNQYGTTHWVREHSVDRDQMGIQPNRLPPVNWRRMPGGPNGKCPVCGAAVWFFRNEDGGCAYFDAVGAPWPKHPCMDRRSGPAEAAAFQARQAYNRHKEQEAREAEAERLRERQAAERVAEQQAKVADAERRRAQQKAEELAEQQAKEAEEERLRAQEAAAKTAEAPGPQPTNQVTDRSQRRTKPRRRDQEPPASSPQQSAFTGRAGTSNSPAKSEPQNDKDAPVDWSTIFAGLVAWILSIPLSLTTFGLFGELLPGWVFVWFILLPTILTLPALLWFLLRVRPRSFRFGDFVVAIVLAPFLLAAAAIANVLSVGLFLLFITYFLVNEANRHPDGRGPGM